MSWLKNLIFISKHKISLNSCDVTAVIFDLRSNFKMFANIVSVTFDKHT